MSLVAIFAAFDWGAFLERIYDPDSRFWSALAATVGIAVAAELLGILFGSVTYLASRGPWLARVVAYLYVMVFRGTPLIVQVFFFIFGANVFLGFDLFPQTVSVFGLDIQGAIVAGTVALGVNEGAYMSEIIRAGIDGVDPGQRESAKSVGMTARQAMRRVILPQAARTILPPLGNQFSYMIKTTSLLAFVGVYELFQDAQATYSRTFQPAEVLLAVGVWYLALTTVWALINVQLERRVNAAELTGSERWTTRLLGIRPLEAARR